MDMKISQSRILSPLSVPPPPTVPLVSPRDVKAVRREDSVLITWSPLTPAEAQGDVTGYRLALAHNHTSTTVTVQDPWLETSQLQQGRVYTVRVAVVTEAGPGPFSSPLLLDVLPRDVPLSDDVNNTVLYAPPQPAWLVYLLIPVVLAISAATLYYVWRLRGKTSSNPPNALTLYEDPSMYSNHLVYGDLKLLQPSDSDRESRMSWKNYMMLESVNEYAEPRISAYNASSDSYGVTEPYATTALLEHLPAAKQNTSDDSGVQVTTWASMVQQSYLPQENIEMSDASLRSAFPTSSFYAGHNGLDEVANPGTNSFTACGLRQTQGFLTFSSIQAQALAGGQASDGRGQYPRPPVDPQAPAEPGISGSNTH